MIKIFSLGLGLLIFTLISKKKLDPKIAFLCGGLVIFFVTGQYSELKATLSGMDKLIFPAITIMISFGFAAILKAENYSLETVSLFGNSLNYRKHKYKFTPLFFAVFTTWLGSLFFMSANASCGMVTPILFPILIRMGISPELAASSLVSGAWGGIMHPADFNAQTIGATLKTNFQLNDIEVTAHHLIPSMAGILVVVAVFYFSNKKRLSKPVEKTALKKKITLPSLRAVISFIPFLIIGLYSCVPSKIHYVSGNQMVLIALLTGCVFALKSAIHLRRKDLIMVFGIGSFTGFKDVIILIITSKIFIAGLTAGLGKNELIGWIHELGRLQIPVAVLIAFFFAIFSGSGDAIITSIVQIYIPHLAKGIAPMTASMVWFAGEMGRCVSPISAATLTVAKISSCDPNKIALKVALPMIVGLMIALFVYLFINKS